MLITKEWVDKMAPNHGRTSCSDDNLANHYGGWDGTFRTDNGHKMIIIPRCNRCYLLFNIGRHTKDLEFEPVVNVWLQYKEDNK